MTQILSNRSLDFREFNLWEAIDRFQKFDFLDNFNPSLDSSKLPGFVGTYRAPDLAGFFTGPRLDNATSKFVFAGDFVINNNNNAVSGTVTGMFYEESDQGGDAFFGLAGFSVGAVRFQEIASSRSMVDDIAFLKSALSGNDRITGSDFDDYVYGRGGNDILTGNAGDDTLSGDAGNDILKGGTGSDRLKGGTGTDKIYGGVDNARDVFIFASIADSAKTSARDVIYNFSIGIDAISLTAIDANSRASGNQEFTFAGTTAAANAVWYKTSGGNATVFADVTGDGKADFSISLIGVTLLAESDFLL